MLRKILFLFFICSLSILIAQNNSGLIKEGAPFVYLDCHCDRNFIKEQIPVINYVGDRNDADIHILFTDLRTGSGRENSLIFQGRKQFAGINDTVKYFSNQIETEDQTRNKMVDALKAGLAKYIYRSKIAGQMKITYDNNGSNGEGNQTDDWDFWVFRTSLRASISGQQINKSNNFETSLSINRVTEESKIYFYFSNQYYENNYDYDNERITSISRSQNISGSYIKSINEHWSVGIWASANRSTWSNIKLGLSASPAIEYDFFPYSESNQRQLTVSYRITSAFNQYDYETIYFKTKENLWSHSMNISLEIIDTWGNAGLGVKGSSFLHDFDLYSLGMNGFISWKFVKGLSIDVRGSYSKIANQITLPRGEASLEEVLLHQKELKTQYSYNFSIGLSYTFGSIYNNAINPRFD